jgi:hypothetical protein
MSKAQTYRPLPSDADGRPIQSGTVISDIINTNVATGAWTRIYATAQCKFVFARLEDGGPWRFSYADGGEYLTVDGGQYFPLTSLEDNQTLFYAQSVCNAASMQVALFD